jgi:hypothetical protein
MKRAIMIFALVSTVAGVASAQMMRSPAGTPAKAPVMAPAQAPAPRPDISQNISQAPVAPALAPTLVSRQAPVPMLVRNRAAFVPPAGIPEPAAETAARGTSEADARAAIEADGYKKVRVTSKGADGAWQARAFRGATEMAVRVDAQGNVTGD